MSELAHRRGPALLLGALGVRVDVPALQARVAELEADKGRAVADERYEEASHLRDEIEAVQARIASADSAPSSTDLVMDSPLPTAASAASSAMASELPTSAMRPPRGSGWWASSCPTSNISSRVSTWTTPACLNIASTAAGGAPIERTA